MFEAAELGRTVSKEDYQERVLALRTDLLELQNDLLARPRFAVAVLIAGVEGAGKGQTVNVLHTWLDPRYLLTSAYGASSDEERQRPRMWRFWRDLPPRGRIGVFFGSWYTAPIVERVTGQISEAELETALRRINAFERELTDDAVLLLKFWFHISKKVQKKRHKELLASPETAWRVSETELEFHKLYDRFIPVCEEVVRSTSTGPAPWTLVEGKDARYRELRVGEHIRDAVAEHMARLDRLPPRSATPPPPSTHRDEPTILGQVDLNRKLESDDYHKRLARAQARLAELSREAVKRGASQLLTFEGWDAAGKGGAIRRVTTALDARFYAIVPIAAPSDEELARPWLWRFWRNLPAGGRLTIFDRSWYGRVLVERVEGLASPEEWRRAYQEINEFESRLCEYGYGLVKFWLHIDRAEQSRRFEEREKTPYKRFKISEEDYRNRDKWELYEDAVNEMIERTSTSHAPWTVVPANDKRLARVLVVEGAADGLAVAIERRRAAQ